MREYLQVYKDILLVDDDSDDRDLFAEAIAFIDPGITVTMKGDGEELMDHLLATLSKPDLIFLDLNMPRKNGKECLLEIRASERHANTPIIIYTTSLNPLDVEETFRRGANYFFRKPNSFEELKQVLTLLLRGELVPNENNLENFVVNQRLNVVG